MIKILVRGGENFHKKLPTLVREWVTTGLLTQHFHYYLSNIQTQVEYYYNKTPLHRSATLLFSLVRCRHLILSPILSGLNAHKTLPSSLPLADTLKALNQALAKEDKAKKAYDRARADVRVAKDAHLLALEDAKKAIV